MKTDVRPSARRILVTSNALDAGGRSIFEFTTDVIAVSILGASTTQMGVLNAAGMVAFLVLAAPVGVLVGSWKVLASLSLGVVLILASGLWVWSLRPEVEAETEQATA